MSKKTIYFEDADHPDRIVRKKANAHELEYISKQDLIWKKAAPNSSYEREYYLGEGNCCVFSITEEEAKERLAQWGVKVEKDESRRYTMKFTYRDTGRLPNALCLNELDVFFSDESCLEIIEKVLDEDGKINNFPGIVEDEIWKQKQRVGLFTDVRYEAQFTHLENDEYLMTWLIQPSGWYWVDDDGFGFTGDSSIQLYSIIDKNGFFTKKFELYSIDSTRYCDEFVNEQLK